MLAASLFQAQGDLCAAEPLYREAVQASRAALGDQHPNTSLASLLQAQGTPRHDLQARYGPVALLSRLCAAHTLERTWVCECECVIVCLFAVNLVALVDWRFIKLHKRQPGERDIPVPAKARPGSESRGRGGDT